MGKGGLYGKRKKQDRPKSFRETSESGGTGVVRKSATQKARENYGSYTKKQNYDSGLATTSRRIYERKRGRK